MDTVSSDAAHDAFTSPACPLRDAVQLQNAVKSLSTPLYLQMPSPCRACSVVTVVASDHVPTVMAWLQAIDQTF